jgi:hypothetical protein
VFRNNKPKMAKSRSDYAKHADFCDVIQNDTKSLYLLAFLLTANHKQSEQCFPLVEKLSKNKPSSRNEFRSWIRRRLTEALRIVRGSAREGEKRDLWEDAQHDIPRECEIDAVTRLAAFERFVFVMSILERYSHWDSTLLLRGSMKRVTHARMEALRHLTDLAELFPRSDELPMRRLKVTA